MRYHGGKSKLAKRFAPILQAALQPGSRFIEPFVGAFNVVPTLQVDEAICSDLHPGVITLLQAVKDGWVPTGTLTEPEFMAMRKAPKDWSNPLNTLIAFGCSFGAREWNTPARPIEHHFEVAKRGIMKKAPHTARATFIRRDYREVEVRPGDVVYCDPPYAETTGYSTGAWDANAFYEWCEATARKGARVFVSEFKVPERAGWNVVWSIERTCMASRVNRRKVMDYLVEVTA